MRKLRIASLGAASLLCAVAGAQTYTAGARDGVEVQEQSSDPTKGWYSADMYKYLDAEGSSGGSFEGYSIVDFDSSHFSGAVGKSITSMTLSLTQISTTWEHAGNIQIDIATTHLTGSN